MSTFMTQDNTRASLELLYSINRELASSLDLPTVLERVLSLSVQNVGAERGSLIVLDETLNPAEAVVMIETRTMPLTVPQAGGILKRGLAGWVIRTRQAALVNDSSQDERWLRLEDDQAAKSGAKSAVCLPLTMRDQLIGVLTIVHPIPNFFTQEHLALLTAIADQASIAVHNARLYNSLQAVQLRYRELFENSIDPILITDWDGSILEANRPAASTLGRQAEELAGLRIHTLLNELWEKVGEHAEMLRSGQTCSCESTLRNAEGTEIPIEVYVRQIHFEDTTSLQWTLRDITERKALDSLRNDLTAMIYHDLRSPLGNVFTSLDMLQTMLPPEDLASMGQVFSIANRSAERLQRLINSLLDISRLEAGQPITNQRTTSLTSLAHEAAEVVGPMAEARQLHIRIQIPSGIPEVWVDVDMIRRVLINLMENATKFSPQGSSIEVGGTVDNQQAVLWVQDSGPGIPPEAQERIFEKFTRLQTERSPKGLGLGLAFCRLAVQAHGGRIWVESKPEQGSRFLFTLPAAATA